MIDDVIAAARSRLGWKYSMPFRYLFGYTDCSKLVWDAYREGGMSLEGISPSGDTVDFPTGRIININEVQKGDLVYKNWDGNGYQHVGLVTDPPYVIEASSFWGVVERANLDSWVVASRPYELVEKGDEEVQNRKLKTNEVLEISYIQEGQRLGVMSSGKAKIHLNYHDQSNGGGLLETEKSIDTPFKMYPITPSADTGHKFAHSLVLTVLKGEVSVDWFI